MKDQKNNGQTTQSHGHGGQHKLSPMNQCQRSALLACALK
jgi:hypothetical protein